MAPGPLGGGGQGGVYEGDGDLVIEGGLAPGAQEDLLTLLQELRARARDGGLASPGTEEVWTGGQQVLFSLINLKLKQNPIL